MSSAFTSAPLGRIVLLLLLLALDPTHAARVRAKQRRQGLLPASQQPELAQAPPSPPSAPSVMALAETAQDADAAHANTSLVDSVVQRALAELEAGTASATESIDGGSPRQTVHKFCDASGLNAMRGGPVDAEGEGQEGPSPGSQLQTAILNDVVKELEGNNADKMAKEIFTFYVCVRWIPDEVFWGIAEQEMAANLVQSIVKDKEGVGQAVAELYQRYKFVPLLCSKNLEVFGQTDDSDHTYFRHFKNNVQELASWLKAKAASPVADRLRSIDSVFCGGSQMNAKGCELKLEVKEFMNQATQLFGLNLETKSDKWDALKSIFNSFQADHNATWTSDLSDWKARFPYHSFIDKPGGMPEDLSPKAGERFLVCFGKRIASELHRRPNGQHIMTDQNNIGCHGWWEAADASNMLNRMVELWKPPTCQLSEMVYIMKKEILMMFKKMNERLFDALPSMLVDEELGDQGIADALPAPYAQKSARVGDEEFIDSMRVAALREIRYPADCGVTMPWGEPKPECKLKVPAGTVGSIEVRGDAAFVIWDHSTQLAQQLEPNEVHIMPHGWRNPKGAAGHFTDLVAGVSTITERATGMFGSMFSNRYDAMGAMMSDSVSKWIVCPIKDDTILSELDSELGVEDAALQDLRKEAYSKWTGYKAKVPGEDCVAPDFLGEGFGACAACEISELHADHVEKYTLDDGSQEQFICPIKPALPFDEQLTVLANKKSMCYLRMIPEQARHYDWHYQGLHPARRQNDRKPNDPMTEYELVKLLDVPQGTKDSVVSFGRHCSLDELRDSARFCGTPKLHKSWPTVGEMADILVGATVGSMGVGAVALRNTISTFQKGLDNGTERAQKTAVRLGENTMDSLFGAGRLLAATGKLAIAQVDVLTGASRISAALEDELFGSAEGGGLLHSLSFQREIGANGRTSNAKDRYQRYVLEQSCADFDPALAFALRRDWSDVARRLVRGAKDHLGLHILETGALEIRLRAEGMLFERSHREAENSTFFEYGASLQVPSLEGNTQKQPTCEWAVWKMRCEPFDRCEGAAWSCRPRTQWSAEGWWRTQDTHLQRAVGGLPISSGQRPLQDLSGLRMTLYCGEKSAFGATGPPTSDEHLLTCLKRGVPQNARLRAAEPWRLYFPEEVVVVATFEDIAGRRCRAEAAAAAEFDETLCAESAVVDESLDSHLTQAEKESVAGSYRGLHSGAGFPKGTPHEVTLRPEDVLEVVGELLAAGSL